LRARRRSATFLDQFTEKEFAAMLKSVRPPLALVALPLLALMLLALPLVAGAQRASPEDVGLSEERLERVTELVQRHIDAGSFTGAVTLVARHGRIAHLEAQGLMDLEADRRMVEDGIFRIMSMTKPVVGVAILMLVDEGKVRLQDPVSRFIPEWRDMVVAVPRAGSAGRAGGAGRGAGPGAAPEFDTVPVEREVTVRDLLTHTSGVMSGAMSNAAGRGVAATPTETLADYIPRLGAVPLEFQPGTRWAYSAQAGFDVLSRIVEIAAGTTIDQFLQERLFDPLDMDDTTYIPPVGNRRLVTRYTSPQGGGDLQPATDPAFMNGIYFSGGGGLFSTAPDYAQFALMLANGGELDGVRILSPRAVELMGSVFIPDTLPGRQAGEPFGLSVRVVTDPAARNTFLSAGSFGWSGLYGTHFWVDPSENLIAVVLTQTSNREFLSDFENMVMQAVIGP
jgi:CubicO group peptidase (beta-lactamase class C family)